MKSRRIFERSLCCCWIMLCLGVSPCMAFAASGLTGTLTDPQGRAISGATIRLLRRADASRRETKSDDQGRFSFGTIDAGEYRLTAEAAGFPVIAKTLLIAEESYPTEDLQFSQVASQNQSVTVSADVSDAGLYAPDPAQRIMVRDETLDANPGRPGMPISIPGMPVESPAGGVK
ncbi:MAG TPA: carboxypeptidase-like regulatory domain-containing protein, partial [Bryobacteraceae bacterium]|nr:carboxypeptidase-like regulatory domain-containing protein [Bryobacteraceae bacterium]